MQAPLTVGKICCFLLIIGSRPQIFILTRERQKCLRQRGPDQTDGKIHMDGRWSTSNLTGPGSPIGLQPREVL